MKNYLKNLGASLSQVLHSILGGSSKVTLSARLGSKVMARKRWAVIICKALSMIFFDRNHCVKAFNKDKSCSCCAHDDLSGSKNG